MHPTEFVQAAIDLQAKKLLPVHWAKFALAQHDWDEPIKIVVAEAEKRNVIIAHPMIGEPIEITGDTENKRW